MVERPAGIPEEHRAAWDALVEHARVNGCLSYEELNDWLPAEVETQAQIDAWLAAVAAARIALVEEAAAIELRAVHHADAACTRLVAAALADPVARERMLDLPGWLEALPQTAPHQQSAMVRFATTVRPGELLADGRVDDACNAVWQYVREHVAVVHAQLARLALRLPTQRALDACRDEHVAALARLAACGRHHVGELIARHAGLGLDAAALGDVAEHALARAAAAYDPRRGYRFAALAAWMIARALGRAIELRASRDGTHETIVPRLRALPSVPLPRAGDPRPAG